MTINKLRLGYTTVEFYMKKCYNYGKNKSEEELGSCEICGELICEECMTDNICFICAELWISEMDLDDCDE